MIDFFYVMDKFKCSINLVYNFFLVKKITLSYIFNQKQYNKFEYFYFKARGKYNLKMETPNSKFTGYDIVCRNIQKYFVKK